MKHINGTILHLETGKNFYGGALQVAYLLKGLKRVAPYLKNIVIAPKDSAIVNRVSEFETLAIPYMGETDPRLFFRLIATIKRYKAKGGSLVLHIHSRRGADLWGPLAALFTQTPYLITRRVDNPEPLAIQRLKYKRAKKIVAISSAIFEILASYGIEDSRLALIPSAVDTDRFSQKCKKSWFKKEFVLGPDDKAVGIVAQFIERKGHRYIIEAIPGIVAVEPRAKFIFLGKGPLMEDIKKEAKRLGVHPICRFPGYREDIHRIIPCLDCLLHPALMEGLGVAVLQAMACMVPVVATDSGGLRDIVIHEKTALRLPTEGLSQEIVAAILRIFDDSNGELCDKLVKNAFQLVREEFSIEKMAKSYMNLYQEILSEAH